MTDERERRRDRERVDTSHLDDIEDGCGCAEVWEHLSEGRGAESEAGSDPDPDPEEDATAVGTSES